MATVKDFSVEEKLIAVLALQKIDSKIDEIKTLKGELPMEVKDLEDEIAGLQTRINNTDAEINNINEFIETKTNAKKEAQALIKLQIKNLSSMDADFFYSSYHYSHPILTERLKALQWTGEKKAEFKNNPEKDTAAEVATGREL